MALREDTGAFCVLLHLSPYPRQATTLDTLFAALRSRILPHSGLREST